MRFRSGCLTIAFIAAFFNFCYAQMGQSVRGSVLIQNKAAEAATVILLHRRDSSVVQSALVNNKGIFQFTGVMPGSYIILTTRLGAKKDYLNFSVTAGQQVSLQPIVLSESNTDLKEVVVLAKKPFVEVRPGKTIINPQASITADGKTVLDILRQSPGVRVDNSDNVSISGRQNALILIDGKATNLTGADLAALLKSTQGSTVDRMELITGASAKYDASAGGIINIVLKKGKNIGTNGTFNASVGYGKFYKGNTGITFNNRTDHFNIFGNYSIAANKTFHNIYTHRVINYNGLSSNYNTAYKNTQESLNHNFRLGVDYFLTPNHTIGVLVNGIVSNNDFIKNNTLQIYNQGKLDSTILAGSTINRDISSLNYNVNYMGKLDEAGKTLSASFTYTHGKRHSDEYITNQFYNSAGAIYRSPLLLQNLSPTKMNNWSGLIDYVNPLPKGAKLDAGLKLSRTISDNNLVFGPKIGGQYTIDPNFSNHFIYTETVSAGYIDFNGKISKLDIYAALRGEYTRSKGNSVTLMEVTPRNYFDVFPSVLLTYHQNDKNEYSLNLNRGILRPTYDKLNPFLYFVDLYTYQAGNPYLKPEYTNSIRIMHTYNQEISTTLYANFVTNATFPFYRQNDSTKVSLENTVNLGRGYFYGINFNAPINFTSWWVARFDIDASFQRYVAYPQNGNLDKSTGDLIIQQTQSFFVTKTLAAEISGKYETATFYGINQFRPNYYLNAGVSKKLWNKLGTISLNVSDVFNTDRDRIYSNYQNLDRHVLDKRESRKAILSFSYRFGKTSVKSAKRHVTGNEGEQNRMRLNN